MTLGGGGPEAGKGFPASSPLLCAALRLSVQCSQLTARLVVLI